MKIKPTYCLHFAILSLFIAAVGPGCWWTVSSSRTNSFSRHSFTGSFEQREFENPEAVAEFNRKARDWFMAHGFTEVEGESFSDLADSESWNRPGVLLRLECGDNSQFNFFIPDCYRPEENIQKIGYRVELQGTLEETKGYEDEFNKLKNDFRKDFP